MKLKVGNKTKKRRDEEMKKPRKQETKIPTNQEIKKPRNHKTLLFTMSGIYICLVIINTFNV